MQDDLPALIRTTAARARARDFLWAAAISAALMVAVVVVRGGEGMALAIGAWGAFLALMFIRRQVFSEDEETQELERMAARAAAGDEAEVEALRLARGATQSLPEPVLVIDAAGVIELANPAAEEFLGLKKLEGRHLTSALRAPNVFEEAMKVAAGEASRRVEFVLAGPVERHCRAFLALLGESTQRGRVLLYVRDITSEIRVEQMRADFVASAGHELRTPLASLVGFVETLRGPAKDDADARERFLAIMQAQAERMQRLVADLMSLSRIELNEHVPPRDEIDLAAVAEDVLESLKPALDQSSAIVDFENLAGAALSVVGDRDQLFQTIQNLVDNALKYGGDPAMIKVKTGRGAAPPLVQDGDVAQRTGETAAQLAARLGRPIEDIAFVQVRDFGPGIERGDLPRLTERFYRANVERSRRAGGTGLGLAIVKHILNRHKGGLQIETKIAGGSAFTCYLPAS